MEHERKINGNGKKMNGNERKIKGNERKMDGNERKINGNDRRSKWLVGYAPEHRQVETAKQQHPVC